MKPVYSLSSSAIKCDVHFIPTTACDFGFNDQDVEITGQRFILTMVETYCFGTSV